MVLSWDQFVRLAMLVTSAVGLIHGQTGSPPSGCNSSLTWDRADEMITTTSTYADNVTINARGTTCKIGGAVNGTVLLRKDDGPYRVIFNIEVQEAGILVVEQGTVLYFGANLGINVQGILNVSGSAKSPVLMTSEIPGVPWAGINISGNLASKLEHVIVNETLNGITLRGPNIVTNNITSRLSSRTGIAIKFDTLPTSNVDVELVYRGLYVYDSTFGIVIDITGEVLQKTTIRVEGCAANRQKSIGIEISANATVELRHCEIHDNRNTAFYINQDNGGSVNIAFSSIVKNFKGAFVIYRTFGFSLTSSFITNHDYNHYLSNNYIYYNNDLTTSDPVNMTVGENTFENNRLAGFVLKGNAPLNLNVYNNTIADGSRAFDIHVRTYGDYPNTWKIRFSGNTFTNNSFPGGALVDIQTYVDSNMALDISNNIFMHNKATAGFSIASDISSNTVASNIMVIDNAFSNNVVTTAFLDIQNYPKLAVHGNIFKNFADTEAAIGARTCELKAPRFLNSTFNLKATHNYWGTRQIEDVVERVCGFDQHMGRSFVYYMPFYTDEILGHLDDANQDTFDVTGALGGEITGDITLSPTETNQSLVIGRSIMIRYGTRVVVKNGMELIFLNGRGIYVCGGFNLQGEGSGIQLTSKSRGADTWYGMVLDSDRDVCVIYNTSISNTEKGIVANNDKFDLRRSSIENSTSDCLNMQLGSSKIFDFQGTTLRNCSKAGIQISGQGNLTIVNISIQSADVGVGALAEYGHLALRASTISDCSSSGVSVKFQDTIKPGNVNIENCVVSDSKKGIDVIIENYREDNEVKISRNVIRNVYESALYVDFLPYAGSYDTSRNADIGHNMFHNSCFIKLLTYNHVNISFHDNIIKGGYCMDKDTKQDTYFLTVTTNFERDYDEVISDVSYNLFNNIESTYIVKLNVDYRFRAHRYVGLLNNNNFLDNRAWKGVVLIDTKYFSLTENLFDSPQSKYAVDVLYQGRETINASNNWWDTTELVWVYRRIWDGRQNSDLLTLNVTPILTQRHINCSGVNNCSPNGVCIGRDRCRCYTGWTGETCDEIDCSGVNSCYGNGICVGPNQCQCRAGWSGRLCIGASCKNVNECSGHGFCVRPDECMCATRFTGSDCGTCEPLHWGPHCQPCPSCVNGNCNFTNDQICTTSQSSTSLSSVPATSPTSMSTSTSNAMPAEKREESIPQWVTPTSIGVAVLVLMVGVIVGVLWALRHRSVGMHKSTSYNLAPIKVIQP